MASYDAFEPLFTNQFIGGEWTASSSPNRIAVENPATLEKFATARSTTLIVQLMLLTNLCQPGGQHRSKNAGH